ncbi:TetR/AcrR family transcriptional regulator [Carnobacterium maltaromaticum]|uniref:TetR/AcrR family transcriptional regulator n=1 Tax=Carnobacterium maltaromaticum TaxID=2751 RepID=UPI0012FBB498|nr:helix-turn-helix domain-containing protein [Carnobacterium maltaromaticum]
MTRTQERIINASLFLISEVGYKSATTKLIAHKARVNEATIFRNFQTKEYLINIAVRQQAHQIKTEVDSFFKGEFNDVNDLLKKTGFFIQATYEKHRYVVIGSIKEIGNRNGKVQFSYDPEYIKSVLSNKLLEYSDIDFISKQECKTISFIYINAILALLLQEVKQKQDKKIFYVNLDNVIYIILTIFENQYVYIMGWKLTIKKAVIELVNGTKHSYFLDAILQKNFFNREEILVGYCVFF